MGTNRESATDGGVYLIWLYLPKAIELSVGKLGTLSFEEGVYAYCGSAQRALQKRLARHARLDKKLHWHIDYLRSRAQYLGSVVFFNQPKSGECWLVQELLRIPGSFFPASGFGSSDCTCAAHLVQVPLAFPKK